MAGRLRMADEASGRSIGAGIFRKAAFRNSVHQLIAVEMRVPAIGDHSVCAALEFQKSSVGAFGWPSTIPGSGSRGHASNQTPAQQPHDIHMMRRLIEDHATAAFGY